MKLILMSTAILFFACNGQKKTAMQNSQNQEDKLQLIISDDHSGADISETLVITDEKALRVFYSKINMTRKPGLPIPKIDFQKEMVVISCSEERNDGLLPTLALKNETDAQLVLSSVLKSRGKNTSQAITSPFSIYKMPLTDKEIIFEKNKQ